MGNSTNSLIRMLELTDALKIFQGPKVKGLTPELWQYLKKKIIKKQIVLLAWTALKET